MGIFYSVHSLLLLLCCGFILISPVAGTKCHETYVICGKLVEGSNEFS